MEERLVVAQGIVGSRPTVRPEAERTSYRRVCQGSSVVEHLVFSICVLCLVGAIPPWAVAAWLPDNGGAGSNPAPGIG